MHMACFLGMSLNIYIVSDLMLYYIYHLLNVEIIINL